MNGYLSFLGHTATAVVRAAQRAIPPLEADSGASAYLDGATSLADLEMRIRELDGPRRAGGSYPTNFSTH
ncbi:MAG: DUF3563 family protein [Proteobacteria bacterium]|nr:DUF3563 family protein [Pseudomonadota bacterium]